MKKNRKSLFHFGVPFLWILGVFFLSMMSVKGVKAGEISPESTPTQQEAVICSRQLPTVPDTI